MKHDFQMMSFARLKDADVRYVRHAVANREERLRLLDLLNAYLLFVGEGKNSDDEKLFVLGQELKSVWPDEFQDELVSSVRKHVSSGIAEVFLAGLGKPEASSKVSARLSPPSKQAFDQLTSRLKTHSFDSLEAALKDFCDRHLAYAEQSGDANLLAFALNSIAEAILRMSAKDRQKGAGFVRDIVHSALRWEPWNPYLWNSWAQGFLAQNALGAAEDVFWESIRRLPPNEHARTRLVGLLQRFKSRQWEALELARETASLLPHKEFPQNVLARVLLDTGETENVDEAASLLVKRLHVAPNNYAHFTLFANAMILKFSAVDDPIAYFKKMIGALPNDPELIKKIQRLMSQQSSGQESVEAFLRASVGLERFKDNALIRNLFAKTLMLAIPAKFEEAIKVLQDTRKLHPDDTYSINQLAAALATFDNPKYITEAKELLESAIQNERTDNEFSRELLAKLTSKDDRQSVAHIEISTELEQQAEFEQHIAIDEIGDGNDVIEEDILPQPTLPSELSRLAQMYRLGFRLSHADGQIKAESIRELHEILRTDPTFAYAQLLAVRQGLWEKEGKALPSFPAAFELALKDENVSLLAQLAKEYPRLEALTIVAQSMFGDTNAAKRANELLRRTVDAKSGVEKMLNEKVGPVLRLIQGGRLSGVSLSNSRSQVISLLRDINEWAIGGGDWRVAA